MRPLQFCHQQNTQQVIRKQNITVNLKIVFNRFYVIWIRARGLSVGAMRSISCGMKMMMVVIWEGGRIRWLGFNGFGAREYHKFSIGAGGQTRCGLNWLGGSGFSKCCLYTDIDIDRFFLALGWFEILSSVFVVFNEYML